MIQQLSIAIDPHPLLRVAAFATTFPRPLGELPTPPAIMSLLRGDAAAPLARDEAVRGAVRDLLRQGGYKPTGRGKPASEYLVRAAGEGGGTLPSINLAVDACNAVSLHSALPISVTDLDRASSPFRIGVAPAGASFVFNASGQEIDLGGLLCLFDAEGPCGNAVKDAQRTKTGPDTTRTLSIVWAPAGHEARLNAAARWYRRLLEDAGARTDDVAQAEDEPSATNDDLSCLRRHRRRGTPVHLPRSRRVGVRRLPVSGRARPAVRPAEAYSAARSGRVARLRPDAARSRRRGWLRR